MTLHHGFGLCMSLLLVFPVFADNPTPRNYSFAQLTCMSWPELDQLYRQLGPGPIPDGYARGKAIYCPGEKLAGMKSRTTDHLWQGKHFCAANQTLINQWSGLKAIRARVTYGPSWLDGNLALILDYGDTSHVWADVRDEMREVSPGLYLGAMFLRRCPCPKQKVFFVLEMNPCRDR
jgi:hypothetical protein